MHFPKRRFDPRSLTRSGLFAAVLCLLSPIAIPVGSIPITLGVFALLLCAMTLTWRQAAMAVAVYLLLGCLGLPVFSGGASGFGAFAGATGGYLWSYLPMVALASAMKDCGGGMIGCLLGLLLCYFAGTWQFVRLTECTWKAALHACVYPFAALDLAKALLAARIGARIRRSLN